MMKNLVLLLGSPIHAISVVLAALLLATGIGSGLVGCLGKLFKTNDHLMLAMSGVIFVYILALIFWGQIVSEALMMHAFWIRVCSVILILCPLGFAMGVFFPIGLRLLGGGSFTQAIPWAWALNCGFSVLGSMLAITLAQFIGFNKILLLGLGIYLIALLAVRRLIVLQSS